MEFLLVKYFKEKPDQVFEVLILIDYFFLVVFSSTPSGLLAETIVISKTPHLYGAINGSTTSWLFVCE